MSNKGNRFKRPVGKRLYRKLFFISTEGVRTEPLYFDIFNKQQSIVRVKCLKKGNDSSPEHVLKQMKIYLKKEGLKKSDEAWLVVDRDNWTEDQLALLHSWSKQRDNFGFALSNPKFEYWLLLHFEDGNDISSSPNCSERLRKYLPDHDKNIDTHKFTPEKINAAIRRAKSRDFPPCPDWPRNFGGTTVYKLVEKILKDNRG